MRVGNEAMVFPLVDCWETSCFALVGTELAMHLHLQNTRTSSGNCKSQCCNKRTCRTKGFVEVLASLRSSEEAVGTFFCLLSSCAAVDGEVALLSRMRETVDGDEGGEGLSNPLPRLTLLIVNEVRCPSAVKTTLGRSAAAG